MINEIIFESNQYPNGKTINLACGYISFNKIVFLNENIIVNVEAKNGQVQFCNSSGQQVLETNVELPLSGDEKFSEVKCSVEDGKIKLGFPQYSYIDNYPNCDGEHDRWTKTILGFNNLCYDYKNNCIVE